MIEFVWTKRSADFLLSNCNFHWCPRFLPQYHCCLFKLKFSLGLIFALKVMLGCWNSLSFPFPMSLSMSWQVCKEQFGSRLDSEPKWFLMMYFDVLQDFVLILYGQPLLWVTFEWSRRAPYARCLQNRSPSVPFATLCHSFAPGQEPTHTDACVYLSQGNKYQYDSTLATLTHVLQIN